MLLVHAITADTNLEEAERIPTDPASPTENQLWYNTTQKVYKYRKYGDTATLLLGGFGEVVAIRGTKGDKGEDGVDGDAGVDGVDGNPADVIVKVTGTTVDDTPVVLTGVFVVPASTLIAFSGLIKVYDADFNGAVWAISGAIARDDADATAFVGTPTITKTFSSAGASAWTLELAANDTSEALDMTVTAGADAAASIKGTITYTA